MMFPFRVFPRIYLALAFVLGVVVFGSVGYVVVEGYSWVEALYMTVITVSTVGFGEVRELSDGGMLFTTVLIMGSIGTFAYSISALTTYFVNGEYRNTFKEARLKQEVEKSQGTSSSADLDVWVTWQSRNSWTTALQWWWWKTMRPRRIN